jgi:hypothetical protein
VVTLTITDDGRGDRVHDDRGPVAGRGGMTARYDGLGWVSGWRVRLRPGIVAVFLLVMLCLRRQNVEIK